jgi:hypothetical protein
LQLFGYRNYSNGYYYIQANLISEYHKNQLRPITFLIDTTSQVTSISYNDSLSLDFKRDILQSGKSISMLNVTMPTLVIPEGGLALKLPNNRSIITEFLDNIFIHNPIITNREDEKKVDLIPSILGLDFLNRYRLTIQNSYLILEK